MKELSDFHSQKITIPGILNETCFRIDLEVCVWTTWKNRDLPGDEKFTLFDDNHCSCRGFNPFNYAKDRGIFMFAQR